MDNKNEINSIKNISEKITNPTMAYDIDEDIPNINNINNSPKSEEKIVDDIDAKETSPYTKKIMMMKKLISQ